MLKFSYVWYFLGCHVQYYTKKLIMLKILLISNNYNIQNLAAPNETLIHLLSKSILKIVILKLYQETKITLHYQQSFEYLCKVGKYNIKD